MANTKQARKRARQTVARNLHLAAQRSQYRTAIKKVRNIVCIEVNQKRVILHLALDASTVAETSLVRNCSGKGHWGTGDIEVGLTSLDELEEVKPLLARAYLEN